MRHRGEADIPEPERALALARAAGYELLPGDDGTLAVRRPLPDVSALTGPGPYVVLHPGASAPARCWPVRRWREAAALLTADRELNERTASGGTAQAYRAHLAAAARLHRFGMLSIVGRGAIADWLDQHAASMSATSGAADAAEAGDIGYSYGTYALKGDAVESGAYIRVWTRDGAGRWLVVADVTQPTPSGG